MVYGYVRVSTDKQTTENQRFEIENYSKVKGLKIGRWVDETISGTTNVSERRLGCFAEAGAERGCADYYGVVPLGA